MSTIHLHQTTTSTPEQFLAALIDFGPGRSKLFGNSADEYLKVHHRGPSDADVTEGSGGIWERLHYDWSDRTRVVMKTTDSNLWGGRSGHTYTFTRRPDGTTDVDAVVVREGKNLKGRALGFVLGTVGKGVLEKAFGTPSKPSRPAIDTRWKAALTSDPEWGVVRYYIFGRVHQTLCVPPAMEAGIANHVWSIEGEIALLS